jgi:hypothetical protein
MKRTTLKIEESVLRRLEQQAAAEGRSLQDVANHLLRRGLASPARDIRAEAARLGGRAGSRRRSARPRFSLRPHGRALRSRAGAGHERPDLCRNQESPRFTIGALALLREWAEGSSAWALPWPCLYSITLKRSLSAATILSRNGWGRRGFDCGRRPLYEFRRLLHAHTDLSPSRTRRGGARGSRSDSLLTLSRAPLRNGAARGNPH